MKIFKLIITSCVSLVSFGAPIRVFASEEVLDPSLNDILNYSVSDEEAEEVGKKIADEKNKQSSFARTSGELWTYQSKEKLYGRKAIKGKYRVKVEDNTSSTYSVTVNTSGTFKYQATAKTSLSLTGGGSVTKTKTFSGPKNAKLSNKKKADYRIFIGLTFAEIYQYTYKVTDKYSGKYLRTVKKNSMVGSETVGLNQLMAVNSNGSITVGNKENTKVKNYSSFSAYQSQLEKSSYTCKNVIYF